MLSALNPDQLYIVAFPIQLFRQDPGLFDHLIPSPAVCDIRIAEVLSYDSAIITPCIIGRDLPQPVTAGSSIDCPVLDLERVVGSVLMDVLVGYDSVGRQVRDGVPERCSNSQYRTLRLSS